MNPASEMQIAVQHHQAGRLAQAEKIYRQVLAQQPDHAGALNLLGVLATQLGRFDEAVELMQRALRLVPDSAEVHYNLGTAFQNMGRLDEAIASFRHAIRLNPDLNPTYNNLANALSMTERFDEAIAVFHHAIGLKPDFAEAHNNLGTALKSVGQLDESIAAFRRAIQLKPDYVDAHSNLIYALLFHPGCDAKMVHEEHRRWNQQHAQPLAKFIHPHTNSRDPNRRLRIGYVSPDFRVHSVSRFLLSMFRQHDQNAYETICYSDVLKTDGMTDHLRACVDEWRDIVGWTDERVADKIREDKIDILVDLAGHTAQNRLRVFARKPAPVQVSYLGYPGTTGLSQMDYRLTDALADPPGKTESLHSEKLLRLPVCNWCFTEPEDAPPVGPLPAEASGSICFGTFNNFAKASPAIMDLWAKILIAVPSSRLLIKSWGLGERSVHDRIQKQFTSRGVQPDRLEIRGHERNPVSHFAAYNQVDIALDTYPYHGTTTSCEAMWMGVPVVCLAGQTHVSRVGVSLLNNVGLPELIAQSTDEYVSVAVSLANDLPRLAELRRSLRQRMRASPLMDAPRFARNVEAAYRQMWRNWCGGGGNTILPVADRLALQQQFESGMSHHRAGRLAEAEKIYRQVLAQKPDYADALHRMGMLEDQMGRPDVGVDLIRRAIQLEPDLAGAHSNLGNALTHAGRFEEAIASHRIALRLDPDNVASQNNLGAALATAGQLEEAIALFQRAVRLDPDFAEGYGNLGDALASAGRLDDAIAAYREVIRLDPDRVQTYIDLGNALQGKEQFDQAIAAYQQAIRAKPDYAEAFNNLGNALKNGGQPDAAIASIRRAIALKPDYAEAHYNLGNVFKDNWRLDEAIAAYQQAIRFKPDLAEAHSNLGGVFQDTGQLDDSVSSFRQAIRLKPDFAGVHSNLLLALNYQPDVDAGEILAEHRAWSNRHANPLMGKMIPHANDRSPERKLRIGYVSADFWRHSVGQFFLPLLEHHDRRNFQLFCYANSTRSDDLTERIKRSCDVWRNIVGVADEAVAKQVCSDGIDILVDLSGHTNGNRLPLFARKPAPIQVTYLGYANTTGIAAIDYRLTDALADPPGMTDHLNTEKLWRLPNCAWCYQPPENAPDIQPRGDGPITFGCFNAFAKTNPRLTAIWAELLKRVPGSRLLLKSVGAGEASSRQRLTRQFAEYGIAAERIEMLGRMADPRGHLELYHRVDVALDTYPYHGTTTTCEALWMGVPVVSLAGQTHVSRVGVSLLNCVGLPELVADTPEKYISIASELASNSSRLSALRGSLRNNLRSSPLMDGARFASEVENAYRQMWRNWCAAGNT